MNHHDFELFDMGPRRKRLLPTIFGVLITFLFLLVESQMKFEELKENDEVYKKYNKSGGKFRRFQRIAWV